MKRLSKREKQGFQDSIPPFTDYPPLTQVAVSNSFVRWVKKQYKNEPEKIAEYLADYYEKGDWEKGEKKAYVFLGEIANMKGHGVYVDFQGVCHWGLHCDQYEPYDDSIVIEIKETEIGQKIK